MEAKDILGYLGIDEVNSLDDFKAKLHEKYLPVSDEKAAYDRFVKPALGKHSNVVKQKIEDLNKWRWIVIGGAAVVGWILSKVGLPFEIK